MLGFLFRASFFARISIGERENERTKRTNELHVSPFFLGYSGIWIVIIALEVQNTSLFFYWFCVSFSFSFGFGFFSLCIILLACYRIT